MGNSSSWLTTFFTFVAVIVGAYISINSWDGTVYFYTTDNNRDPAAINSYYNYSNLEGHALKMASHKRLLSDLKVYQEKGEGEIGIELGHFVTRGFNNQPQFACDVYSQIELTFQSDDQATSGETSKMFVQSKCKYEKDVNRISTIWIPMAQVMEKKIGDIVLQFFDKYNITMKFENMGDHWPNRWTLYSVRLNNQTSNKEIFINNNEVREIMAKTGKSFSYSF